MIELMVVIAIISLLSSLVIAQLQDARKKARAVRRIEDLKTMRDAIELYAQSGSYPVNADGSAFWWDCYPNNTHYNDFIPGMSAYLPTLPHDPSQGQNCQNGGNAKFNYSYRSNGIEYKIEVQVPNGTMEYCDFGKNLGFEDPVRPCTSGDPAWAVYSPGASGW